MLVDDVYNIYIYDNYIYIYIYYMIQYIYIHTFLTYMPVGHHNLQIWWGRRRPQLGRPIDAIAGKPVDGRTVVGIPNCRWKWYVPSTRKREDQNRTPNMFRYTCNSWKFPSAEYYCLLSIYAPVQVYMASQARSAQHYGARFAPCGQGQQIWRLEMVVS